MKQPAKIIVQLIHIQGPLKGEIQEFSGYEITMGRHPSCDLRFPQDMVVISRKHAAILRDGNRFKIIDQSTNGTFVNGEKITEAYLKNGDVIFFTQDGPKVSFLTRIGEGPEPPDIPVSSVSKDQDAPREAIAHPVPRQPEPSSVMPLPSAPPETVKVPLVVQYGPILQSFNELPITIGADLSCDLPLDHPSLDSRHVQVFFSRGNYGIKDLTGRNQVLVNNRPIASSSPLIPGDKLFLTSDGPAFHFIEGGRMAEIHMPQKEACRDNESAASQKKEAPSGEKRGSLFKNFFR